MVQQEEVAKKIRQLGVSDRHFQLRQVREGLGVPASSRNEGARISGIFHGLEKEGAIEQVPSNRKRNRYYRIVDEEKLRGRAWSRPSTGNGNAAIASPAGSPGDRLARIEHDIRNISDRIDQLDDKVGKLVALWS